MNARQVSFAITAEEDERTELANAAPTYQEDRAFLNRNKKIRFRNMTESELKRVWAIAERGMDARENIENGIRDVNRWNAFLIAEGMASSGWKLSRVHKFTLELLKGLR